MVDIQIVRERCELKYTEAKEKRKKELDRERFIKKERERDRWYEDSKKGFTQKMYNLRCCVACSVLYNVPLSPTAPSYMVAYYLPGPVGTF